MKTKQRGNQEGTFYQRKNGRWCGQIMIDNKRYTAYGRNKQECKIRLREKIEQQPNINTSSILFNDYANKLLKDRLDRKEIGINYYQSALHVIKYATPTIGYLPLSEITSDEINKFTAYCLKNGLVYSTIKCYTSIILSILNKSFSQKLTPEKISISNINLGPKEVKTYPPFPIEKFIEEIEKIKRKDIRFGLLLLIHSGLRISELRGLKWDDIDLKTGKIYIKRAIVLVTSLQQDIITDTKGKRIGEFVQIPESFITVIEEYVRENKGKSEWVFTNDDGKIISYSMFRYYARIIVSKLGIDKGFCLHLYRHAHASLLVKNNVDLKTIQAQLRHTNIETTSRYLHELTPSNRPSISKIDI